MTPYEVGEMLAFARQLDGRRPKLESTDAQAWHRVLVARGLGDSLAADLEQAVIEHYGRTNEWMMPGHLVTILKRYRAARLKAAGDIHALVTADRDDAPACHAEFQRLHAEIAAGRRDFRGQLTAPARSALEAS